MPSSLHTVMLLQLLLPAIAATRWQGSGAASTAVHDTPTSSSYD